MWIGVSGEIAAGKTSIARALADRLPAVYASFGDVVRREAVTRDLPLRRKVLQDLGAKIVAELGPEGLVEELLREISALESTNVVVEGVRHLAVDDALRAVGAASGYHLIFVDTPEPVRAARLAARGELGSGLAELESHPTERDVHRALRERAEIVVSGEDAQKAVVQVLTRLGQ
jgi:dephospho-CoA kinase